MEGIPHSIIEKADTLSPAKIKNLLIKTKAGDGEAKDKLIRCNLRLVLKMAHRFKNSQYSLEDVFQVGTIGLIKAIERFDIEREVKFSTYAVPLILGEIKMFLRDDHPVKVSRSLKEKAQKIRKIKEKLTKELNREPTIQELSERVNLSREEIVNALEAVQNPTSIYNRVNKSQDNGLELIDQLGRLDEQYDISLNHLVLKQIIEELDQRSQRIIKLRYFADKSQTKVAKLIGVSQAHVSRLENKILNLIRNKLE
ncbi:RNA polymerase sigma-70 factor, sigma-B/F/G subfamily [Halobacteroides halobius DSM 5150]|uniref:RNA polymerase sigma-70 factor, sigma-B/F/G subfamily n=1 Tax=Halobacteroides halobius (strain ATCC 35273 / DSM 5150 / MD-1) TaxID=748449 RepID=L0K5K1_HALHC|nr:SigB/SigF/SigG family RNA polymerase sigma factor [Halobacteroides halobius]AGB40562.1 RNA polymerase sigma-70 factor, sigma-B/F/G subfamily [Halobacteroides halobius DSM 5150]